MNTTEETDRFEVPLYTVAEAARYLQVPPSTLSTWVDGYIRDRPGQVVEGAPVVTAFPRRRHGEPRLPFVGLAEAYVLNAFRKAGVPLQRIRPSLDWLTAHVGPHALASKDLYTDGAEVLWHFAQHAGEGTPDERTVKQLIVPRSGQYVFRDVVDQYLRQVTFNPEDGYANLIRLPQYRGAEVVVDPRRGFGHPIFAKAGVRLDNVLGSIRAGESFEEAAADYGVPVNELRDAYALSAAWPPTHQPPSRLCRSQLGRHPGASPVASRRCGAHDDGRALRRGSGSGPGRRGMDR